MNIIKIQSDEPLPAVEEFIFQDGTVQGAKIGKKGDFTLIASPRRFKLFTDGEDKVFFLEGEGYFKWKRGETPFYAPAAFLVSQTGEYEVNGNAVFLVKCDKKTSS